MKSVVRRFALVALSATALTALSQSASAAVLWDITGGAIPSFTYSTQVQDNNVVNYAGQPAANNTGSTLNDTGPTASANWLGSTTTTNSFLSFTNNVGTVTVQWTYAGSESGDLVNFSTTGFSGSNNYDEHDLNNNNNNPAGQNAGPVLLNTVTYVGALPNFSVLDKTTGTGVTNGGTNGVPGSSSHPPSLIFAYLTGTNCGLGGQCTVSDKNSPTNVIVFGFNDTGSTDDNHDDIMIIGRIISSTDQVPTPIPGALPLFGSVLGGGFLFRRYRKRRQARAA